MRCGRMTTRRSARARRGGEQVEAVPGGYYVRPAIVEMKRQEGPVLQETFAPILYVMRYRELDEAIALNNACAAGAVLVDLHHRHARSRSGSCPRPGPTAGSPTSTSARRAPRSAARSAARRRPAAGARAARTLARLHAAADQHRELRQRATARPGHPLRHRPIARAAPRRADAATARRNACFQPLSAPGSIGGEIR